MTVHRRILVVGVGSDFGDDRVGQYVVDRLATRLPPGCEVRKVRAPADILDQLDNVAELHVVDGCRGAGPPGSIIRGDGGSAGFSGVCLRGTHDLDVVSALRLAETLNQLPPRATIWGVEMANDGSPQSLRAALTMEVAAGADGLVECIIAELHGATAGFPESHRHA